MVWAAAVGFLIPAGLSGPTMTISGVGLYLRGAVGATASGCLWSNTHTLMASGPAVALPASIGWVWLPVAWRGAQSLAPAYTGCWIVGSFSIQNYGVPGPAYIEATASATPGNLPGTFPAAVDNFPDYYIWKYPIQMRQRALGKATHP
jgi:hypothetical protein